MNVVFQEIFLEITAFFYAENKLIKSHCSSNEEQWLFLWKWINYKVKVSKRLLPVSSEIVAVLLAVMFNKSKGHLVYPCLQLCECFWSNLRFILEIFIIKIPLTKGMRGNKGVAEFNYIVGAVGYAYLHAYLPQALRLHRQQRTEQLA